MGEKLHTIATDSIDNAIAPLSQRLEEVLAKTNAIQQEQKATVTNESKKTARSKQPDSEFVSMSGRVANTLNKRAQKKTTTTTATLNTVETAPVVPQATASQRAHDPLHTYCPS